MTTTSKKDVILIIAGGRDFDAGTLNLRKQWYELLDETTEHLNVTCVVCGMARGADLFGKEWAVSKGIPVKEMPANWEKWGRQAGFRRNTDMALIATHLIAIWDGKSKGTSNMIDIMKKFKKPYKVLTYA